MKFYSFGDIKNPVILLLPGTCCHWRANFGGVISLLEQDFYVVCVSYDGFDETEPETVFPDMISETERIETYINKNFGGCICAAYGCSLGGSFVSLLVQRKVVHIDHGILGSSDMDQGNGLPAQIQAVLMKKTITGILHAGKLPGWMQKCMDMVSTEKQAYYQKFLDLFCAGGIMGFVQEESVCNQFYSDLVTRVDDGISVPGTTIHCFYAEKMGEKYLRRYRQHFQEPDIHRHPMQHEELLLMHPQEWYAEVFRCCKQPFYGGKHDK